MKGCAHVFQDAFVQLSAIVARPLSLAVLVTVE